MFKESGRRQKFIKDLPLKKTIPLKRLTLRIA
jgi:hypothetical protein